MKFPELAAFDSDSIPRGLDALKIHVADANRQRVPPYATVGEYLAELVALYVADHVRSKITTPQENIVRPALARATDEQLAQAGAALGVDLIIDVPDPDKPLLARLGVTSTREDAAVQPEPAPETTMDRLRRLFGL